MIRHGLKTEYHQFPGLGKSSQICLFQIMLGNVCIKIVKPSAAVMARPHVLKIGHQGEAEIARKMLVRGDRISGFRTGINHVKLFSLLGRVVSGFLIAFCPIGIFNRDFAGGIRLSGRLQNVFCAYG